MTDSPNKASESPAEDAAQSDDSRRSFVAQIASIVIGGFIGMFSLLSGLIVFFDPLARKKKIPGKFQETKPQGPEGHIRIASLNSLQVGGLPQRFPVIDDKIDAWNFSPNQPVGAVFIQRTSQTDVQVLHATCPHAGCSVSPATGTEGQFQFHCPCHNSSFGMAGGRIDRPGKDNPSPRDMDGLNYVIQEGDIWVEYKDFYTGVEEQKAKI